VDRKRPRTDRFEALQALAHTFAEPAADAIAAIASGDEDPVLRLAAARTLLARRDARGGAVLVDLLGVKMGPQCDDEDRQFVQTTAGDTLREITGAKYPNSDVAAWRKMLPGLEKKVAAEGFEYAPAYLLERW
jgi:hypothetical protein